jgi:hypothetical protein
VESLSLEERDNLFPISSLGKSWVFLFLFYFLLFFIIIFIIFMSFVRVAISFVSFLQSPPSSLFHFSRSCCFLGGFCYCAFLPDEEL